MPEQQQQQLAHQEAQQQQQHLLNGQPVHQDQSNDRLHPIAFKLHQQDAEGGEAQSVRFNETDNSVLQQIETSEHFVNLSAAAPLLPGTSAINFFGPRLIGP